MAADTAGRLVWDLPVRITHWLLVLAVIGAWISDKLGPAYFTWHIVCGCTALVLVVFRVLWGFIGTRHARFSAFLRKPVTIVRYLRGEEAGIPSVGHNPLGAWSVVVLLGLLLAQAVTGLFANDEIANAGPFYGWVSASRSKLFTSLHHRSFLYLEIMVALHVAAVLFYTLFRRARLIGPMVTGLKPASSVPAGSEIAGSRVGTAAAVLVVLVAVLLVLLYVAPTASLSPF